MVDFFFKLLDPAVLVIALDPALNWSVLPGVPGDSGKPGVTLQLQIPIEGLGIIYADVRGFDLGQGPFDFVEDIANIGPCNGIPGRFCGALEKNFLLIFSDFVILVILDLQ